jgi:CHASE2 domain-containing sensor protein
MTAGVWIQAEKAGYLVSLIQGERSAIWIPEERWAMVMILLAAMASAGVVKLGNSRKLHIFLLNGILILIYGGSIVAFVQFTAWIPLVPLLIGTITTATLSATLTSKAPDRQSFIYLNKPL